MFTPARRRRSRHLAAENVDSPPSDPKDSNDVDECLPANLAGDERPSVTTTIPTNIPAAGVETTSSGTSAEEILPPKGDTEEGKLSKAVGTATQPTNEMDTLGEADLVGKDTQTSSGTAKASYIPAEKIENNDRLWKDYVKEATEEDKDMLDSWNNDLETLLVFSGLFSAILTAFLIESHKDLKPDPSSAIVVAIECGFRLANNITDSSPISSTGSPEQFTAQTRSVRINALWFSSLSMSLISAAGAMLGKSWLVAYSRQLSIGSPVQRAEKRQNRFDGLNRWGFQATIDFLPFPLFFSIILFAIGLCDFLFGLHQMIGILSATIFISSSSFLVIANLLRIIIPDCPYHIPIPIDPPSIQEVEAFAHRLVRRCYPIRSHLNDIMLDIRYPDSNHSLKWLAVTPLVARCLATLIHLSVIYLLRGLIEPFLTLVRWNERWVSSYSPKPDWQARGLAWIVHSSSDDGVVRNALQLIPAVCIRVANSDVLCKTEILSALRERFVEVINGHVQRRSGTGTVESELAAETYALGHSLRLLAGYRRDMLRGVASSDETRFGEIWWVNVVPPSHSTPIHLLCKSLSLVTYHPSVNPSSSAGLQADLALKPASGLGDWLRLFLIQDAADLHSRYANNDGDEGTLSMICDLMAPVKLTQQSSAIFLSAIQNLYSGLDLSDRTVTPTSILARNDSANFGREFASILSWCTNKIMVLYEEAGLSERYLHLLGNTSITLLKITYILRWELDLDNPKAPNSKDVKGFIKWTLTNSDLPIQVRAEAIKILSNLEEEYIAGWEDQGEIKTRYVEIISQFRDDSTQDDATISAVRLLISHMEGMGIERGRIVLGFLDGYPEAAAGTVAIIQRGDIEQVYGLYNLQTELLAARGYSYYRQTPWISPLNENVPNEAISLTRQILSKFINAGLKEALISRLAAQNGEGLHFTIQLTLWMVCTSSSLAKGFILDHNFTAQLISCAKRPLSSPEVRWWYVAIIIQLSYQVVDVCSDEEQATWHRSLIELDFLTVYATLLPFLKDREPKGSMMWDIQCSFPLLQALVQMDKVAVAESKVIEAIEAVLQRYVSSGVRLLFVLIWTDTEFDNWRDHLSANTVLQELRKIRVSMTETDPHPKTLAARDDELPL